MVDQLVKKCHFLYVHWNSSRQLTRWLKINKADKSSSKSFSKSNCFSFQSFKDVLFGTESLRLSLSLWLMTVLACGIIGTLLVRGGIESNPGPAQDESKLCVISQNCRGLTDRNKFCRILRKIYPASNRVKSANYTIACLQETHCIDKFVASCIFRGKSVIDDSERNQRGVCILIPEGFELCDSLVSGVGRWAIAVVKLKDDLSLRKFVVANLYAPNCHREAHNFYQDFFVSYDGVVAISLLRIKPPSPSLLEILM